jgi:50S ribosomal protein L16 3-hydroxylase
MRQGLPGFRNPLSPGELAGLACEEEVESRLVQERGGSGPWEVRHGPFTADSFAALPRDHWTLLVQDVDKHVPEVARWRAAFRFLPDWRVDDIMVSFAAEGGSVGPHVDEYDVFLIQAEGGRRWHIDPAGASGAAVVPGLDVPILADFHIAETHVLQPGDVLYLPPRVPHWGIAEGPCMTWSVGFRAPAWRELALSWSEHVAEHCLPPGRYRDPAPAPQTCAGEILPAVFAGVRETLTAGLCHTDEQAFRAWFGRFATEPKEHLEVYPADSPISAEGLSEMLRGGRCLRRNAYTRMAFCRGLGGVDLLFVNGAAYELPSEYRDLLAVVTGEHLLGKGRLAPWLGRPQCLKLLCRLYNEGHYALVD